MKGAQMKGGVGGSVVNVKQLKNLLSKQRLHKGLVSPLLSVPPSIERPPYVTKAKFPTPTVNNNAFTLSPETIKTPSQIEAMRRTGHLAAKVLDYAISLVQVRSSSKTLCNFKCINPLN